MTGIEVPAELDSTVRLVMAGEVTNPEQWLDALEREEAGRIRLEKRREEWVLGRIAAKRLAIHLGLCSSPADCAVPTRGKKPFLMIHGRRSELSVSISHSGPVAAAAIAPTPVGIDVQMVRRIDPRAIRFFLREDERDLVGHDSGTTLLDLWCAKEAALKAAGASSYREVRLRRKEMDDGRTQFLFRSENLLGEIETRWLLDTELVLAVARGTDE